MNWLMRKAGEHTIFGYLLKVIFIVIGVIILSLYWAYDSVRQLFCLHCDCFIVDDESIICNRCGKETDYPQGDL